MPIIITKEVFADAQCMGKFDKLLKYQYIKILIAIVNI